MTTRVNVPDLQPSRGYVVQVRAVGPDGVSEWSRQLAFTTLSDTVFPNVPTNHTWAAVGDTFHAEWDAVTQNTQGDVIPITRYEVELVANSITKIVSVPPTTGGKVTYDLTFAENRALFGTPQATVTFKVRAVDNKELKSAYTNPALSATNPPPAAPTAPAVGSVAAAGVDSIALAWTPAADNDIVAYNIYVGTTAGFTPTSSNRIFSGNATRFTYLTTTYTLQYFKIRSIDTFGQESTDLTGNATPSSSFSIDATAPAVPTGLSATITNNANGIGASAAVTWTMSSPPADLNGFYVRYRKVGDTNYSVVSFTSADRAGTIELQSAFQNYEFQIKAYDWSNNESAWSSTFTATSPANAVPANVTGLTATPGRDSIVYSWTPVADADLKNYEVTFSTSPTFASGNVNFNTGTSSTLTVSGLAPSTTYYARVRAVDQGGLTSAAWTGTNTTVTTSFPTTPLSDGVVPAAPAAPSVMGGIGNIFIDWTAVTLNASGGAQVDPVTYEVHISVTSGFTPNAGTKAGETSGTIIVLEKTAGGTALAYGTTYYVKLIAKDRDGASAASAQSIGVSPAKAVAGDVTITPGDIGAPTTGDLAAGLASKTTTFSTTGGSPTTPTAVVAGDLWIHTNAGITKIYRATAAGTGSWSLVSDDSALPTTFVQSTAPTALAAGDVWVDTDDGKMYRSTASGSGSWVLFNDPAAGGNKTFVQDGIPTSTAAGDIWVDSNDSNKIYTAGGVGATAIGTSGNTWILRTDLTTKTRTFVQVGVPVATAVGDMWVETLVGSENRLWVAASVGADAKTAGEWELYIDPNLKAGKDYVQAKGTDLVVNGTGSMLNNFNFTSFTFDPTDAPTGAAGSFDATAGLGGTYLVSEFLPVDPNKKLKFSYQIKQKGTSTTGYAYAVIQPYDAYKNGISPQHVMYEPNTLTTLAAPLNPGDLTVTLTSSANWMGTAGKPAGGSTHRRSFIWWDYTDPGGKLWPPETYSRNYNTHMYADGAITGNVITLNAPWAGPAKPAGTLVSNGSSGGTYMYPPGQANFLVASTWTKYDSTIIGLMQNGVGASFTAGWPPGVAYAKIGWLLNRQVGGTTDTNSNMSVAAVSLSDAQAAQDDATFAITAANGKNKVTHSTSVPGSTANTAGDTWFQYNGSNQIIGQWRGNGGTSWTAQTIENAVIANLDGGKITANSITTQRLIVSSFENLIPDAYFEGSMGSAQTVGTTTWSLTTGGSIDPTGGKNSSGALKFVNKSTQQASYAYPTQLLFHTEGGANYRATITVRNVGSALVSNGARLGVRWTLDDGSNVYSTMPSGAAADGVWTTISGIITAPSNAIGGDIFLTSESTQSAGILYFDFAQFVRATDASRANSRRLCATKMVTGTITAASGIIADAAITTAKIADAAITTAKIGDAQIVTAKIADAQITTAKIGDAQITNAKIADLAVNNAKIANATITDAKIADLSVTKLTAGTVGGGFGITMAAGSSILMNGGYIKSNTYTGTTQASNPSNAGFYLGNDGLRIDTGQIKANALVSDTLTSTTITLGSGGVITGGTWSLSSTGLTIPDGGIAASKLLIQTGTNIMPPIYADFEAVPTSYAGKLFLDSGTGIYEVNTTGGKFGPQKLGMVWSSQGVPIRIYLGASTTDYNIPVEGGKTYIFSAYVYSGYVQNSTLKVKWSNGTISTINSQTTNNQNLASTAIRNAGAVVAPAGVTGAVFIWETTTTGAAGGVSIDGVQVEEQLTNDTAPSSWKPPGYTRIDGAQIRTGEIRSTAVANILRARAVHDEETGVIIGYANDEEVPDPNNRPAWFINTQGAAEFSTLLIRGNVVVGDPVENIETTSPIAITINTTNASTAITANSGTFYATDVGLSITGAGIPVGATIATVTDSANATLSANATATATEVAATINRQAKYIASISSANYIPGTQGWTIRSDGTAEVLGLEAQSIDGGVIRAGTLNAEAITSGTLEADVALSGSFRTVSNPTGATAALTNASAAVVLDSTGGVTFDSSDVGILVTGPGIPVNTRILSVTNATNATLTANVTATNAAASIMLYRGRTATLAGGSGLTLTDQYGNDSVRLPTDPTENNYFAGSIEATDIFVRDEFRMFGVNNSLGQASELALEGGQYKPATFPNVRFSYGYVITRNWGQETQYKIQNDPYIAWPKSPVMDYVDNKYKYISTWWGVNVTSFDTGTTDEGQRTLFGSVSVGAALANGVDDWGLGGFAPDTNDFHFLTRQHSTMTWRHQAISRAGMNRSGGPIPADRTANHVWVDATAGGLTSYPCIARYGGNTYVAKRNANSQIVIYRYNGGILSVTAQKATNTGVVTSGQIMSLQVGQFDFGTGDTYVIVSSSGSSSSHRKHFVFKETTTGFTNTGWHIPYPYDNTSVLGLVYRGSSANDASGVFKTITTDGYIYNHTKLGHMTTSNSIYVSQRWRNNGTGGGTIAIGPEGPVGTYTYSRRSNITLTSRSSIPNVGGNSPNALTFYMGTSSGTRYRYNEPAAGVLSQTFTDFRTTDAAGTSTVMTSGVPAKIFSNSGLEINGNGEITSTKMTLNGDLYATHLPRRVAVGSTSVSISASTFGSTSVSFPAGRFSSAPMVTATCEGTSSIFAWTSAVTSTGMTLGVRRGDGGGSLTNSFTVNWVAIQFA